LVESVQDFCGLPESVQVNACTVHYSRRA
jgi:hypothetical protein